MVVNNFLLIKIFLLITITFFGELSLKYSYGVEPDEILKNEKQELRARMISKNIRCMVCQNQSIDESNAPLARDLRILIREKITNGEIMRKFINF